MRANVSSFTRHHPNVMMTKAKVSGNYANCVLAKTESLRLGFDEAIMLDPQGIRGGVHRREHLRRRRRQGAHAARAPILNGITRQSLVELAPELGYTVQEQPVSRDQLYSADEVFVCGTAAEVIGLREIDFRTIGSGRIGPVTQAFQRAYHSVVRGEHKLSARWLTEVHPAAAAVG